MKKLIYILTMTCILYAGNNQEVVFESKLFDIKSVKNEKMKNYLIGLEKFNPIQASILKDYYEALTCRKDFFNAVGVDELSNFSFTKEYEDLINLTKKNGAYDEYIEEVSFFYCKNKR